MKQELLEYGVVKDALALLEAWIEAQMAYGGHPGVSLGVVIDQELVWAQGYGWADVVGQKPATPQTIYRIASITKLFTSTALVMLRDAGRLQLDDPVEKHLPWFEVQSEFADAPPITVRHLITHTSGLPREAVMPYWATADFPDTAVMKAGLSEQSAIFAPETEFKYSNLALSLAGEVVAAVAGMAYEDYVKQNILEPLGMRETWVHTIGADHPQLAVGYGRRLPDGSREISPHTDSQGLTPAFNMATSVEDLARFAMLHFRTDPNGEYEPASQLLHPYSLREMQRVHWMNGNWRWGAGLGFHIDRSDGETYIGHGGAVLGFRTQLTLRPKDRVAVIALTNSDDGNPLQYVRKLWRWLVPALLKAKAGKLSGDVETFEGKPYVGKYRSAWGDVVVLVQKGQLMMMAPNLADPTASFVWLTPAGKHTFRMKTDNNFGRNGELVRFEVDEETREVVRVVYGGHFIEPVDAW